MITGLVIVFIDPCGNDEAEQAITNSSNTHDILPNRLIRLVDPLDDADHYCIDVRGFGPNPQIHNSLQARTCKPNDNRDQQFTYKWPSGLIYSEEFDLCMEAESLVPYSSQIFLESVKTVLSKDLNITMKAPFTSYFTSQTNYASLLQIEKVT